jgi:hypothetical protein
MNQADPACIELDRFALEPNRIVDQDVQMAQLFESAFNEFPGSSWLLHAASGASTSERYGCPCPPPAP